VFVLNQKDVSPTISREDYNVLSGSGANNADYINQSNS
jgi:hypothetical protein